MPSTNPCGGFAGRRPGTPRGSRRACAAARPAPDHEVVRPVERRRDVACAGHVEGGEAAGNGPEPGAGEVVGDEDHRGGKRLHPDSTRTRPRSRGPAAWRRARRRRRGSRSSARARGRARWSSRRCRGGGQPRSEPYPSRVAQRALFRARAARSRRRRVGRVGRPEADVLEQVSVSSVSGPSATAPGLGDRDPVSDRVDGASIGATSTLSTTPMTRPSASVIGPPLLPGCTRVHLHLAADVAGQDPAEGRRDDRLTLLDGEVAEREAEEEDVAAGLRRRASASKPPARASPGRARS